MHELHFMTNLVRMVEEICAKQSGIMPAVIKLEVASYSHLAVHTQDELRTMFQFVARDTCAHQARLEVTTRTVTGQCRDCGSTIICQSEPQTCPSCDSLFLEKETGPEVVIQEIMYQEHPS